MIPLEMFGFYITSWKRKANLCVFVCHLEFKGKALHHRMPRYKPSVETNFRMEMNKIL